MPELDHTRPAGGIAALVVAAGRGMRATGSDRPKQFVPINGSALLAYTLRPLLGHADIDHVVVVRHEDDAERYMDAIRPLLPQRKLLAPAIGGRERQDSVRRGLEALRNVEPSLVLIHDAARPYLTSLMLDRLLDATRYNAAATLAAPMTDTVKRVDDLGLVQETLPRQQLWRAETPQAFRYHDILQAHRAAAEVVGNAFTDDASIAEWAGIPVAIVDSQGNNSKVTSAEDLIMADARLGDTRAHYRIPDVRTGQGFDVHKFTAGDHVWLCGIRIPHRVGVEAHSDGDVALHALTDALLGAIGDGDIGVHFKNTDPRWRNASSDVFLADARRRVALAGGTITNVDVTILCEAPKVGPHREAMRERLAAILDLEPARISIKATTTETLGALGRGEGLAALATATVVMV